MTYDAVVTNIIVIIIIVIIIIIIIIIIIMTLYNEQTSLRTVDFEGHKYLSILTVTAPPFDAQPRTLVHPWVSLINLW